MANKIFKLTYKKSFHRVIKKFLSENTMLTYDPLRPVSLGVDTYTIYLTILDYDPIKHDSILNELILKYSY